jgi:hypothetical protein
MRIPGIQTFPNVRLLALLYLMGMSGSRFLTERCYFVPLGLLFLGLVLHADYLDEIVGE